MIEHVHTHITSELQQNTKTDTIFILTSIFLNLLTLAVNSGMVEKSRTDTSQLIVMFIFVALIVVVNVVIIIGLMKGKETRTKLISGLIRMYEDQDVAKYYDSSLLHNYNTRYNLFILVVIFTGLIATVVPFVLR
jgi:type IV secretory pathway component VirB8